MRKFRILTFILIFSLGLGPAIAQEIYVKRDGGAASESRRSSIFLSPSVRSNSKKSQLKNRPQRSFDYMKPARRAAFVNDRMALAQDTRDVLKRIEIYHSWEKSERTPETLEEITSYAAAKMAMREGAMISRRKALIASLQKEEERRSVKYAEYERQRMISAGLIEDDDPRRRVSYKIEPAATSPVQQSSSSTTTRSSEKKEVQRSTFKRPGIFVRPDEERKKRGVFTGWR